MQKLIPIIYFYVLSLIGIILLIIGIFNTIHFVIGSTVYEKYPLKYNDESRCVYPPSPVDQKQANISREECQSNVEKERLHTKLDDMEKSISFTLIGLIVFGIHFYFARKDKIPLKTSHRK